MNIEQFEENNAKKLEKKFKSKSAKRLASNLYKKRVNTYVNELIEDQIRSSRKELIEKCLLIYRMSEKAEDISSEIDSLIHLINVSFEGLNKSKKLN